MKQVTQSLLNGNVEIVDLPLPRIEKNQLLIKTTCSLISGGTERMLIKFGQSNIFQKQNSSQKNLKKF